MTLHEAIIKVLTNNKNIFMSFEEIADEIKKLDLWKRPSDNSYPPAYQIKLRTVVSSQYKHMFEFEKPDKIKLI
jgi:hypothetical protein